MPLWLTGSRARSYRHSTTVVSISKPLYCPKSARQEAMRLKGGHGRGNPRSLSRLQDGLARTNPNQRAGRSGKRLFSKHSFCPTVSLAAYRHHWAPGSSHLIPIGNGGGTTRATPCLNKMMMATGGGGSMLIPDRVRLSMLIRRSVILQMSPPLASEPAFTTPNGPTWLRSRQLGELSPQKLCQLNQLLSLKPLQAYPKRLTGLFSA